MNVNKSNFIKKYYDNRTEVNSILRVSLKIDSKEVHALKYNIFDTAEDRTGMFNIERQFCISPSQQSVAVVHQSDWDVKQRGDIRV